MPGARNKLFDESLIEELLNYIEVGNYVPTACAAVGISPTTYYRWLTAGQNVDDTISDRDDYDDMKERMLDGELVLDFDMFAVRSWVFRERVLQAAARSEAYAVATIRKQMPNQWTAAMTFLERRFPNRWKRREQIDVGEADAAGTGIDETMLLQDPQAVRLIHDALERVAKGEIAQVSEATVIEATVIENEDQGTDQGDHIGPVPLPVRDDEKPPSDESLGG